MLQTFAHYAQILACGLVLLACICRVDLLRRGRSRFTWFVVYVMVAMFTLGLLIDLLRHQPVDLYAIVGVCAWLLYMTLTRKNWHRGSDPDTDLIKLRHADGRPLEDT